MSRFGVKQFDSVGEVLKHMRNGAGVSQEDVATKLGLSSGSGVSKLENNYNSPTIETLEKYAAVIKAKIIITMIDKDGVEYEVVLDPKP